MKKIGNGGKKIEKSSAKRPRCVAVAQAGITTGRQFASLMSALMADLIDGSIAPQTGNAICNASGKLLKIVEMQHKYGHPKKNGEPRELMLSGPVGALA